MVGVGIGFRMTLADGPAEVRKATRHGRWAQAARHQIKIMAGGGVASLKDPLESVGFSEAEMRAAVEAAADYEHHTCCAHAYIDESVQRCDPCWGQGHRARAPALVRRPSR